MSSKTPDNKSRQGDTARAERLAAALRANLHRRKAQGRARQAEDSGAEQGEQRQEKGEEWTES